MKIKLILALFLLSSSLLAQTPGSYPPAPGPRGLAPTPGSRGAAPAPAPAPPPFDPYGSRSGAPGAPFSSANAAAMHFLNIIDNQGYHGAWLESGGVVHDVVSQEVWAAGTRAVRMHKGQILSRKVTRHRPVGSLAGGLRGEIMIIEYETHFANGSYETETITLMSHPPVGTWRVINYRIGH